MPTWVTSFLCGYFPDPTLFEPFLNFVYFIQEYFTQIGGTWEFSLQPWDFIITIDNHEIVKWIKSRRIWKITTQEGSYPRWQ